MSWRIIGMVIAVGALCGMATVGAEEPPPITQLPSDMAHLAVAWVAVPQHMYTVAQDEGPLMGLTVGTVEGSSAMVEDAAMYLTSGYHNGARATERHRPAGALLHYSF